MFIWLLFPAQVMAQQARAGRRYLRAFVSGFFVAVPVTVTVLDRLACVARVEGASMQVSHSAEPTHQGQVAGTVAVSAPPSIGLMGKTDFSVCVCSKFQQ